jgi:hypothetical protein
LVERYQRARGTWERKVNWRERLPRPEEIEFTAWPRELTPADYARATNEVVDRIHKLAQGASIYHLGIGDAPGISDLDFLVVPNDEGPEIEWGRWEALKRSLSPTTGYILMHRAFFVSPELWPAFLVAHDFRDVQHLAGPVLSLPKAADYSAAVPKLIMRVESRVFRPYHGLLAPILRRQVRVRPHLKGLFSIRHTATVLAAFGVQEPKWSETLREISQLREAWFSLERERQIHSLYEQTLAIVDVESQMLEQMSKLLTRTGVTIPELERAARDVVGVFDDNTVLVQGFDAERSREYSVGSYEVAGQVFYMLPSTFMVPFLFYIARGSHLRRHLEDRIAVFCHLPDLARRPVPTGMLGRLEALDQYLHFLQDHRLEWGMPLQRWVAPLKGIEPARTFWESVQSHIEQPSDIIVPGLRRQLVRARTELSEITDSESWKAASFIRKLRQKVATPGSLLDGVLRRSR